MRCLALADHLREKGSSASFLCRELRGDLCDLVESQHFLVHRLRALSPEAPGTLWSSVPWRSDAEQTRAILAAFPQPCDWLVVDHYGLSREWETSLRPHVGRILVIDDLADRPHDCDLLLDQNLQRDPERRYQHLVPAHCRTLFGPEYALLRSEFHEARSNLRSRDGQVRRIQIFFGGTDADNHTGKALQAMRLLGRPEIAVDVVAGCNNPHGQELLTLCASTPNTALNYQVRNMAERMAAADLGIGAGGITTWERCFLGLPCITVAIAANQQESLENAAAIGCVVNLGWSKSVSAQQLRNSVANLLEDPARLRAMTQACLNVTSRRQGRDELVDCLLQAAHA